MIFVCSKYSAMASEKKIEESPERKKSRPSSRHSENPDSDEEYEGGIVYACKGNDHTIEHVYDMGRRDLRIKHWAECVLKSSSPPKLASDLADAELKDCLSTVALGWAAKEWGTVTTEDQLKALKEGQSAQIMDEVYRWEALAEDNELEELLKDQIPAKSSLEKLYKIRGYVREAKNRLKAVNHIVSRIPEGDRDKIKKYDSVYKLMACRLEEMTDDPRSKLVSQVALYHWFLKTDLVSPPSVPLI